MAFLYKESFSNSFIVLYRKPSTTMVEGFL